MKTVSESSALKRLSDVRDKLRTLVAGGYEHRAKSCIACDTPGACCLDEHFVNVRISRLEAVAIGNVIRGLPPGKQAEIVTKIDDAIERYGLVETNGDPTKTFACPLYEKGTGCLVHAEAKPLPCIQHACYENAADLPPDELLDDAEAEVDKLNRGTYRSPQPFLPIPLAIKRFGMPG